MYSLCQYVYGISQIKIVGTSKLYMTKSIQRTKRMVKHCRVFREARVACCIASTSASPWAGRRTKGIFLMIYSTPKHFWLVVWNMFYFSILGIITPTDWYFSEGLKPPTRFYWEKWWLNGLFNEILWVDESYYHQVAGWLVADPFQAGT